MFTDIWTPWLQRTGSRGKIAVECEASQQSCFMKPRNKAVSCFVGWTGGLFAQAYYLAAPFAIERAPTVSVRGVRRTAAGGVTIVQLSDYPVCLVFSSEAM